MKKYSLFGALMAFALSTSSALAIDVETKPTDPANVTNGYYVLKTRIKGTNGYIYHKASDTARPFRQKPESSVTLSSVDNTYVWYVTKANDGALVIQNAGDGAYFPAYNGNGGNLAQSTTLSNAAVLMPNSFTAYANSLEGGFTMAEVNYTTQYNIHANTDGEHNLSYWTGGEVGDKNSLVQFALYKVTTDNFTSDKVTTAYGVNIIVKNGEEVVSNTHKAFTVNTTATPSADGVSYYYSFTAPENTTVTAANTSFEFGMTKGTAPFTASTADSKTWYTISLRNDAKHGNGETYYLVRQSDSQIASRSSAFNTTNINSYRKWNNALWAFEESNYGVKLYNKAAKKYATVNNDGRVSLTSSGTVFTVKTNSSATNAFALQVSDNKYIGDHDARGLWIWNDASAQNDNGSGLVIHAIDDAAMTIGKTAAKTAEPYVDNNLTIYTSDNIAAITNGIESATTVKEIDAAYANISSLLQPEAGVYYRIKSIANISKKYVASQSVATDTDGKLTASYNRELNRTTANDGVAPQLWTFEKQSDGSYHVRNANTGAIMCNFSGNGGVDLPVDDVNGGNYTLKVMPSQNIQKATNDNISMFQLIVNNKKLNANGGGSNLVAWNDDTDCNNYWQIEKVTSVPVAISAAKYASVAFPFATQVATSGVKAFYVSAENGSYLTLTEITDGIIPANTGALLYNEAGAATAQLTITTTSNTVQGNKLIGATASRKGFTEGAIYLLSKNSNDEAAFMKNGHTTTTNSETNETTTVVMDAVPVNKAYVLASSLTSSEAQVLNFNFGGQVTGINAVKAAEGKNTQFFDLNGRRVLYPAHGVFVTNTGKKVFIK